jgi:hypothetical protein
MDASRAGVSNWGGRDAPKPALQVLPGDGWHPATVPALELYFVGIGDLKPGLLDELVDYFGHRFDIRIGILSPLMFDRVTFDPTRRQIVADELIAAVRRRYPDVARQERTRVIAVTPYDMYMRAMATQWTFTFSLRSPDKHSAVVSYAHGSAQPGHATQRKHPSCAPAENGHEEHWDHVLWARRE